MPHSFKPRSDRQAAKHLCATSFLRIGYLILRSTKKMNNRIVSWQVPAHPDEMLFRRGASAIVPNAAPAGK